MKQKRWNGLKERYPALTAKMRKKTFSQSNNRL